MASSQNIKLPQSLTIETVESFADQLRQQLDIDVTEVSVDASGVELITTPGVQLLVALGKSLEARNGKLRLINAGSSFFSVFSMLGMDEEVSKWEKVND